MWPSALCTAQRVTVISPRLKRLPVPPARPRAMTSPVSGWRSRVSAGCPVSAQQASSWAVAAQASTASQRRRCSCGCWGIVAPRLIYMSIRIMFGGCNAFLGQPSDFSMTSLDATPLERGSGIAVWRQIAHRLESDFHAGDLKAGTRLPTEAELAARFTVNRHTVRRAIADLAARGLIRVEQGRGTFLQDLVIDYPLRRRTSFSANLLAQDRAPTHDVLETIG